MLNENQIYIQHDGKCPDCGTPVSVEVKEGQFCSKCSFVFFSQEAIQAHLHDTCSEDDCPVCKYEEGGGEI